MKNLQTDPTSNYPAKKAGRTAVSQKKIGEDL
jgi:hypothetical protein